MLAIDFVRNRLNRDASATDREINRSPINLHYVTLNCMSTASLSKADPVNGRRGRRLLWIQNMHVRYAHSLAASSHAFVITVPAMIGGIRDLLLTVSVSGSAKSIAEARSP